MCEAAAAFHMSYHFDFDFVDSDTVCYVMFATSPSLSLTPSTYLAGRLRRILLCLALFSDLSSAIFV